VVVINALLLLAVVYGFRLGAPVLRHGSRMLASSGPTFAALAEVVLVVLALWGLLLVFGHAARELWLALRSIWPELSVVERGLDRAPDSFSQRGGCPPPDPVDGYGIALLRRAEAPAPLTPYPFSVWSYHDGADAWPLRQEASVYPSSPR
jgi:hypothetical protein